MSDPILRSIFVEALDQPTAAERARFLDEACGGDAVLREQVDVLLRAHDEAGEFLAKPDKRTIRISNPLPTEKAGDRIGRYRLLQQIGEGGCGVVYMAEQEEPVRRRVALKVIKLGMDTKQVIARFEAERQALALMDHPNIAKVLDAGATETGRPYFVMELVRGVKITEFCDENKLPTEDRLRLFVQVCQAIQHAHQKGIIHRDIKPSNVLVTVNDAVPLPKVIDFGIAKATAGKMTDQTLFTAFEQFIGTPAYMSPEQAVMTSQDIDTRSDVYSLGVLLYELLAGRTPFDAEELVALGVDAMRKIIHEKEPMRPSTRLATLSGVELTTTANRRSVDTSRLVNLVKGDLDWVVMKCLEKDRGRRYETANGLAMELARYLHNEPILARPPSRLYRLRKMASRNKLAFAAVSVTATALLVGSAVSTWQSVRARRAEKRADLQRDAALQAQQRTEEINRFLTEDLLYQATPDESSRGSEMTIRQLLELAVQRLDAKRLAERDPQLEATLRLALGNTYHRLGLLPEAESQLKMGVKIRQRHLGTNHWETLLAQLDLISLEVGSMNRFDDQSERLSRETFEAMRAAFESQSPAGMNTNGYRLMLDVESLYIWALANRGEREKAVQLKRLNSASYERVFGANDRDTINELGNLALILTRNREYDEAGRVAQEALRRYAKIGKADSDSAFLNAAALAEARFFSGDLAGAESVTAAVLPRAAEILGPTYPATLRIQAYLARSLAAQGRFKDAELLARDTMLKRQATLRTNDVNTAISTLILGRILVNLGHLDEAQSCLEAARTCFRDHSVSCAELAAESEIWLGAIQLARRNLSEAEGLMLSGADRYLVRGVLLSEQEQHESIAQLINLFTALNKPEQAGSWRRRLDEPNNKPVPGEGSTFSR